jgi:hypothetical protein
VTKGNRKKLITGRFWRKALAGALALLIVSGSMPMKPFSGIFEHIAVSADAEGNIIASGNCGNPDNEGGEASASVQWALDDTGVLKIYGTGAMIDYSYNGPIPPWYNSRGSISKVIIQDGVTTVGDVAFFGCKISEAELPESILSIGDEAFCGCSFSKIVIPANVKSIGDYAFNNCENLSDLSIPTGVTSIGSDAFQNTIITEITIPETVTELGLGAFTGMLKLKNIYVNENNTCYKDIDGVLLSKDGKVLISYPSGRGQEIIIPDGVTSIQYLSLSSNLFKSITIPNGVTSLPEKAFDSCCQLSYLSIPSSVTSIGENAFWGCDSLYYINYGGTKSQYADVSCDYDGLVLCSDGIYSSPAADITYAVALASPIPDQVYTGKPITPIPELKIGTFTLKENSDYTIRYDKNIYVGGAKIIIDGTAEKGDSSGFYGSKGISFNILPKEVGVTWDNEIYTYNGQEQSPTAAISGLCGNDECNFTVSGGQVNAGTYTAEVTELSNSNYKLPETGATKTFTIQKATPKVTAPTANTLTYNGNEQELVTAGSTNFGKVLYSLDGVTYSEDIPKGTDAKTYTVYYKVEGTDNWYEAAPKTVVIKINKATPKVTPPTAKSPTWTGDEYELISNGSTDFGTVVYSLDSVTYSEDIPKGTDAKTYTVYYKVEGSDNWFEAAAKSIKATIAKSYTVTWKNGDETLETDKFVRVGTAPEYNGETPTKDADAQYTYTFSGWSDGTNTYTPDALPTVSGDVTYTAQFSETVNKYTVTWKNGDTVLETDENVEYGATPEYNGETPTKEGNAQYSYPFSGWSPEVDTVTGNVTYTAQFSQTVNKYNITWVDGDGNTLKTDQVEYGQTPVYTGDTPTKSPTAQYSYTFTEWDTAPAEVTGNATYTAQFSPTVNQYTVKWVDGDGNTLKTETLNYGSMPSAYNGDTPTKTADAQYTYTFSGWDNELSEVTGETTYTAQFNGTVNKYTVTWENGDTVLETDENVEYGTMPEYNGATPKKASTSSYTYSFAGWSPAVSSVKGDVTYTATFTAHSTYVPPTYYTITYKVDGEVYKTASATSGSNIALIDEPTKEGYTFSGWQTSYTTMPARNIEITGTFAINQYAVTYMVDGVQYGESLTVDHGTKLTAPEAPTKNGAIFLGWTADGVNTYDYETSVTAETTLTAMWLNASGFITFSEGYAVTDNKFNGTDRDYVGFRFAVNMDNSNYTVVQHGILYGMNVGAFGNGQADANLRFTDEEATALMDKVREFAAKNTDTETTDWIEVYIGDRRDGVVYARGFIIVTDGTNKYLIYSDVQQGSYNSFSE